MSVKVMGVVGVVGVVGVGIFRSFMRSEVRVCITMPFDQAVSNHVKNV